MKKHSLWDTVLTVLANLVSKFVTQSRLRLVDDETGGHINLSVTAPYVITQTTIAEGKITIAIVKEGTK